MNWTDENINKAVRVRQPGRDGDPRRADPQAPALLRPAVQRVALLLDAFRFEIRRAPLIVVTRLHADLSTLLPQIRGLARSLGKGKVKLLLVRGR